MSNYGSAPSFGGPFTYAQPWPPSHPTTSNPVAPMLQQGYDPTEAYAEPVSRENIGSFQQNSTLPGLGGFSTTGQFPPPLPFMGLPPPPFPPFPMSPVVLPPMPLQTGIQQDDRAVGVDAFNGAPHALEPRVTTCPNSTQVSDREEGEVSEMEGQRPLQSTKAPSQGQLSADQSEYVTGADKSDGEGNRTVNEGPPDEGHFQLPNRSSSKRTVTASHGEVPLSDSHSSTRASGSPYNPPVSITAIPDAADSEMSKPTDVRPQSDSLPDPKEAKSQPNSKKSLPQLRVQAQGALLSLAPHNIRYKELVGEGINPTILKQLYEEIGIKVATPQPDTPSSAGRIVSHPTDLVGSEQRDEMNCNVPAALPPEPMSRQCDSSRQGQRREVETADSNIQQTSNLPTAAPQSSASQSDVGKPLERKEVIARMLAAKTAKTSKAPQAKPDIEEPPVSNAPPSTSIEDATSMPSSSEVAENERESRAREKNKAKTELARQRMELLKKQGLTRGQQRPQSQANENEAIRVQAPSISGHSVIRHPLPNRPPIPDSAPSVSIPTLSVADQSPSQESAAQPGQGAIVGSAPQGHVAQRKRPRASDFDEPSSPNAQFTQSADTYAPTDRVIIDISDDEDLYGGDNIDGMDIDSSADQVLQDARSKVLNGAKIARTESHSLSPELATQKHTVSLDRKMSSPSTINPPFTGNDLRGLRQKDLEIQAMRRRIAEMEERKKIKPTPGRAEPAESSDSSRMSEADNQATADPKLVGHRLSVPMSPGRKAPIENGDLVNNERPDLSAERLASMESGELENMRLKLIRKMEIESGLPALDDEILKSETRLMEVKEEEEALLVEIAKGKQDRCQLVGELQHLESETGGLSLEVLEATQHRIECKQQTHERMQALAPTVLPPNTLDGNVISVPGQRAPERENAEVPSPVNDNPSYQVTESVSGLHEQETTQGQLNLPGQETGESGEEPSALSILDSGGSAMDESSDSDTSDADREPTPENSVLADTKLPDHPEDTRPVDSNKSTSISSGERLNPHPERPQLTNTVTTFPDPTAPSARADARGSRKSSVASEAYEPPEPEPTTDFAEEPYTPPFSPGTGPAEPSDVSGHSHSNDQLRADKSVAGTANVLNSDTNHALEAGHLDHVLYEEDPGGKFSPYFSPLRYFKAYRFHPDFVKNVPGAYRSLTYSNNIDPMKYVCPFEVAGGVCNDRSCEYQHFRDMTLSDDKILVQMGSLREGKTQEEKDKYLSGLKEIINDMRRDQVKDFNTVATEIAAYRRRFLRDPSRILPL